MKLSQRRDTLQTVTVRKEESFPSSAWLQLFGKQAMNNTKWQWLQQRQGSSWRWMCWRVMKSTFQIQEGNVTQAAGSKEGRRKWLRLTRQRTRWGEHQSQAGSPLPCQLCKPRVETAQPQEIHSPQWKWSSSHNLFSSPEAARIPMLQSKDGSALCWVDRRVGDRAKTFQCNCLWSLPFY